MNKCTECGFINDSPLCSQCMEIEVREELSFKQILDNNKLVTKAVMGMLTDYGHKHAPIFTSEKLWSIVVKVIS